MGIVSQQFQYPMADQERAKQRQEQAMRYLFNRNHMHEPTRHEAPTNEHPFYRHSQNFCENSLILVQEKKGNNKDEMTLFMPAYVRCHFRNMIEMDIQNLSSKFVATINMTIYLASAINEESEPQAKAFAELMHEKLYKNLKITFQNDFVLSLEGDVSNNASEGDKLVRVEMKEFKSRGVKRYYTNVVVSTEFKFGLHSDIFFFPLEQNTLDLVMALNSFKTKVRSNGADRKMTVRFNCMDLEMEKYQDQIIREGERWLISNPILESQIKQLHLYEYQGSDLTDQRLRTDYIQNKDNKFFRNVKISFPQRENATEFGYYSVIEKEINIQYTDSKQFEIQNSTYQSIKNCLFCKKKTLDYAQTSLYEDSEQRFADHGRDQNGQRVPSDEEAVKDQLREKSFCSAILKIPMLKASLGTIIQLCIPIFFLSFLTLVEFLYSNGSSDDETRGLKIGASSLIVATYISYIYAMRGVIPPTPSWSIFEVAVLILAASSIMPIIESLYEEDYTRVVNPFTDGNALFIAAFAINAFLCGLIIIMLIIIKIYEGFKLQRTKMHSVKMPDLINGLTRKYFYLWRSQDCRRAMIENINRKILGKDAHKYEVYYEDWSKVGGNV